MTILSKFGSNWATGSRRFLCKDHSTKVWLQLAQWFLRKRFLCEFPIGSYVKLSSAVQPSWSEGQTAGHIFGREPSNDYFIKILLLLSKWFQTRRFLWEFPIGSYVKLSSEMPDTILEEDHPRIISANFVWDWLSSFRGEDLFLILSPFFYF